MLAGLVAQDPLTGNTRFDIVLKLRIHPNAQKDIRNLKDEDINGMGKLLALLREISADAQLLDQLNIRERGFDVGQLGRANVRGFASQRPKRDLWRLKTWDSDDHLIPYRMIYAFFPAGQQRREPMIEILAVVHRDRYNYELGHAITLRVINDYDDSL